MWITVLCKHPVLNIHSGRQNQQILDIINTDINMCLVQQANTRLCNRSFAAAAGPQVWNSLPTQLLESDITLGQS